jgi:antitoxin StbD
LKRPDIGTIIGTIIRLKERAMTQIVLAEVTASVSELKKNPMGTVAAGEGAAVAILNRNQPAFYCVPAETYEAML